jgi:hypothetical protein
MIGALLGLLYIMHWAFYSGSKGHIILSLVIHFSLVTLIAGLTLFAKNESGSVEKEHISRDKESNVIG